MAAGAGSNLFQTASGTTLSLNGVISGVSGFIKIGTGTLALGNTNTYNGDTVVSAGVLQIAANDNLGNAARRLTVTSGTLRTTASFSLNRDVTLNSASSTLETTTGTTLSATGILDDGGVVTGSLTKIGAGTLVLSNVNTYRGGTTVNAGVLQISQDRNLGAANTALSLDSGTLRTTATFTVDRATSLGAGGGVVETAPDGAAASTTLTLAQAVDGAGKLTKQGSGTLILAAANDYQGGTDVNAGVVQVASDQNLGRAGTLVTLATGTLRATASFVMARGMTIQAAGGTVDTSAAGVRLEANGVVGGDGRLTKTGDGVLVLAGSNTYRGGTSINGGVVEVAANDNLGDAGGSVSFSNGTLRTASSFSSARAISLVAAGTVDTTRAGETLSISGTISGGGSLRKDGAGTLVVTGTNTYTGGTTVAAGILQGNSSSLQGAISNAAQVIFDQAATGTYSGVMSGSGELVKQGSGQLNLTAINTLTGTTSVNAGILNITGSIGGNADVASGATIMGTGSIGRDVTNSGTIIPGNLSAASGTLTINGNYRGSGVIRVGVQPGAAAVPLAAGLRASAGPIAVGGSSVLTIVGNADFTGTRLEVQPVAGGYVAGTRYRVVDVTGNTTGTAGINGQTFTSGFVTLKAEALDGPGEDIFLEVLALAGGTPGSVACADPNARSVERILDFLPTTGDIGNIVGIIQLLPLDDACAALAAMSGDIHPMLMDVMYNMGARFLTTPRTRLAEIHRGQTQVAAPRPVVVAGESLMSDLASSLQEAMQPERNAAPLAPGFWLRPFGGIDRSRHRLGLNAKMAGVQAGYDREIRDDLVLGATAGFSYADVDFVGRPATANVSGYQFGGYSSYTTGAWLLSGTAGIGYYYINTDRHLRFSTIDRHAKATYGDWQGMMHFDVARSFRRGATWMQPYVATRAQVLRTPSFSETGADSINLNVSGATKVAASNEIGVRLWQEHKMPEGGVLRPEVSLGFEREWLDGNRSLTAEFQGGPGVPFRIRDPDPAARNRVVGGLGLSWSADENLSLFSAYSGAYRADQMQHALMLGLRVNW